MVDDWHELLVRRCTAEADGVLSFELVDPAGADLVPWEPGAHIDVRVAWRHNEASKQVREFIRSAREVFPLKRDTGRSRARSA